MQCKISPLDVDDSIEEFAFFSLSGVKWGRFFDHLSPLASHSCVSAEPQKVPSFIHVSPLTPLVPHSPQLSGEVQVQGVSPLRKPLVPRVVSGETNFPSHLPHLNHQKASEWERISRENPMTDLQLGVLLLNLVRQMNLAFEKPDDERLPEFAGIRDALETQAAQLGVTWDGLR
jgi:hypothetical protein